MLSAAAVETCLDDICEANPEKLGSPDILGIGVINSIAIQTAIALGGLLSTVFFRILRGTLCGPRIPRNRIQSAMDTLAIMLDEFQRAQCCFAITINVASLITIYEGQHVSRVDRLVIGIASTAGLVSTTMNLAVLMFIHKHNSGFTFMLTLCTWILSLVVKLNPRILVRGGAVDNYDDARPAACGMNSPLYICNLDRVTDEKVDCITFTVIAAIVILIYRQWWSSSSSRQVLHRDLRKRH